jgi:hypothetical protein
MLNPSLKSIAHVKKILLSFLISYYSFTLEGKSTVKTVVDILSSRGFSL